MAFCLAQMQCKDHNLSFLWVWCILNLRITIINMLLTPCSTTNATLNLLNLNKHGTFRNAQVVIIPPKITHCLTLKTKNKWMTCFFLNQRRQIYLNHKVHFLALRKSICLRSKRTNHHLSDAKLARHQERTGTNTCRLISIYKTCNNNLRCRIEGPNAQKRKA